MPFKSKAQQAYMFIHHPEIAKEFAEHTDFSHLPKKVKKKKSKKEVLDYIKTVKPKG